MRRSVCSTSIREELERFVTAGIDPETHRAIGDLPRGRGILGAADRGSEAAAARAHRRPSTLLRLPEQHPEMETFLGVPVTVREEVWGNLYLTEKAGGEPFTDADEESAIILADWAAIAIDNARLYASVEQRRDHLERAVRGLDTTVAIAQALGGETNLSRILELIVKRARALVRRPVNGDHARAGDRAGRRGRRGRAARGRQRSTDADRRDGHGPRPALPARRADHAPRARR